MATLIKSNLIFREITYFHTQNEYYLIMYIQLFRYSSKKQSWKEINNENKNNKSK
jgi:hypothetical protein